MRFGERRFCLNPFLASASRHDILRMSKNSSNHHFQTLLQTYYNMELKAKYMYLSSAIAVRCYGRL